MSSHSTVVNSGRKFMSDNELDEWEQWGWLQINYSGAIYCAEVRAAGIINALGPVCELGREDMASHRI